MNGGKPSAQEIARTDQRAGSKPRQAISPAWQKKAGGPGAGIAWERIIPTKVLRIPNTDKAQDHGSANRDRPRDKAKDPGQHQGSSGQGQAQGQDPGQGQGQQPGKDQGQDPGRMGTGRAGWQFSAPAASGARWRRMFGKQPGCAVATAKWKFRACLRSSGRLTVKPVADVQDEVQQAAAGRSSRGHARNLWQQKLESDLNRAIT